MIDNNIDITLNAKNKDTCLLSTAFINNSKACEAKVSTDDTHSTWTISSWYTVKEYQNAGLGKITLGKIIKYLCNKYGNPSKIEYIWNGTNEYVGDWLKRNFDAVCNCPIWIQKTQSDDDWSSHIYELNVGKVIKYFSA